MYANKAVPCWQIFDEGYVRRYVSGANLLQKRRVPEDVIETGAIVRGNTLADLARQIDVPAQALEQTVQRFNEFAAKGLDPDFGRGQSAYNICLGDPGYKPNAALGPIDRAPFYATRVFPADVGTCGGVITNEHAQVIDEHDRVIDGLYATGNITATVMGRRIWVREAASRTRWCSATSPPCTPRAGELSPRSAPGLRIPTDHDSCAEVGEPSSPLSMKSLGFKPDWMKSARRA